MQNTTAPTSAPLTLEQVPRAVSDIIERLDRIEEKLQDPQTEKKQDLEADEDGVIWLTVPELCAYLPDHPAKPTVYGWVYDKLIKHSGLLCLDFDHVQRLEDLFLALKNDPQLKTRLLFRSPSGDGLKWIIEIDLTKCDHAQWFRAVANNVFKTYHVPVDQSGKDICRACFLPWDPKAYLNDEQ